MKSTMTKETEQNEAFTGEEADKEEKAEQVDGEQNIEEPVDDEDQKTQFYRLAADFQNYKKRVDKEKKDIYAYAGEKIMLELLSVLDNFERALDVECSDKGMLEGMKMIFKQFIGVLESQGLKEIPAYGETFDPNFHHAVIMAPVEGSKSGLVAEVMQKGYLLNDKVIRYAMVKVVE